MDAQSSQGAPQLASNQPIINEGKWTSAEHEIFLAGLKARGCDWIAIAEQVRTRTASQVRSHAQKYFNKQANDQEKIGFNREMIIGAETQSTITRSKIERPKIEATPLTKNTQENQKEKETQKEKKKEDGEKATHPLASKKSIRKQKKKPPTPQRPVQKQPEQNKESEMMPEEPKRSAPVSITLQIPILLDATEIEFGKSCGLVKPQTASSRVSMAWTECTLIQEMLQRLQQPGLDLSGMHAINRCGFVGCFRRVEINL